MVSNRTKDPIAKWKYLVICSDKDKNGHFDYIFNTTVKVIKKTTSIETITVLSRQHQRTLATISNW